MTSQQRQSLILAAMDRLRKQYAIIKAALAKVLKIKKKIKKNKR